MASIEDILTIAEDIRQYIIDLPTRLLVSAGQIVIYSGLSDISESLGMIQAGEFRAGNRNDPGTFLKTAVAGTGFTGMRMAYPALTYNLGVTPTEFHLVGINDDVLQFGVNATNGTLVAGAGAVVLSATGITATAGLIAGWTINSDYLGSDGTPGIKILSTGAIETSDFVSGLLGKGWRISEAGNAEFNNAVIRGELRTTVLTYQEVQAISGTMGVFKSAGVILETTGVVPAAASSMNIKVKDPDYAHAALFAVNDVLWIKDGTNATWFTVTTVTDNTTYYTYACRVESGSTGNVYTAGQAIVNFGVTGEGYLLLEATGTGAPYFSVRTTSATPWTGATNLEHVRMGNLNGNWGYVADIYGVAIGKYDTNLPNITVDPTNGLRIRAYDSATPLLQLDTSGNALLSNKLKMSGNSSAIAIGATPPTASNAGTGIWIDKTGLYTMNANNVQIKIDATTGILYAADEGMSIDDDGISFWGSGMNSDTVVMRWWDNYSGTNLLGGLYCEWGGGTAITWLISYTSADTPWTQGEVVLNAFNATNDVKLAVRSYYDDVYVDSDFMVGGNYMKYANSTEYTGSIFVPLTTPLTSTSWDIDAYSTAAKTIIDLSSVFSAPAGIKAVLLFIAVRDSDAAGTDTFLILSPNDTANSGTAVDPHPINDRWQRESVVVPCDANGDIYYQIAASGVGTFDVLMQIWGYFI